MKFSYSFPWWLAALGLAAAVVIIIMTYRRLDKPLSRRLKATLIALRVAAVLLLLVCLLEPALTVRDEIHRKANLLILVDDSQSMSLKDADSSDLIEKSGESGGSEESRSIIPRIDAVKEALAHDGINTMSKLADRFQVQLYQFSSECTRAEELPPAAEGNLTDIGKAISKAAGEWRGQLTAGIVLITDGANNTGESPVEVTRRVNMPIHTVGVGSMEVPRDIQIARVEVSPIAYAEHALPVRAVLKSSGYDGREVPVELRESAGAGRSMSLLDSVSLTLDSQKGEQVVDLQLRPQQEGTYNFAISVPVAPEELTDQNNVYPFFVKVVKKKLRILYVDGRPRWEYTFLKRALQRDPNVEAKCMVAKGLHPGAVSPPSFPATRRELFPYDVLIIGDISPGFFSAGQLGLIDDFVDDKGGSVIFLGGKRSLGRGGFGESALSGMLPIEMGPGGARQVKEAFSAMLTQEGLRHPVTRFGGDQAENMAIWRELPALTQFYEGTGVKLGATVLAERERVGADPRVWPVIVFQRYGKGVAMLIASDSLWRWAFGAYPFGGDDAHYRKFWSRTVRWLASINTQADLVNVETEKTSYHRDEKVQITAYIYDEGYTPVSDAELKAQIQIPGLASDRGDAPLVDLKFASDGGGRYSAEFVPARDGHHKVHVEAYQAGVLLGKGSAEFMVQTTALEFRDTQVREAFLKDLADISGGSYHHLNDISALPGSISEVSDSYVLTRERGLWDNAVVLIAAVTLLGVEWLLRKRKGLV